MPPKGTKQENTINEVARKLHLRSPVVRKWVTQNKVLGEPNDWPRGKRDALVLSDEDVEVLGRLKGLGRLHQIAKNWPIDTLMEVVTLNPDITPEEKLVQAEALFDDIEGFLEIVREERDQLVELVHGADSDEDSGL